MGRHQTNRAIDSATLVAAVLLILAASIQLADAAAAPLPPGFWDIDIQNGPAPSPEKGPPLSANASRDPSLLPAQVCGILAGYIGFVGIFAVAYFAYGRKARREALMGETRVEIEMVKSNPISFGKSPASPTKSWLSGGMKSLKSLKSKSSIHSNASPPQSNPNSPGMQNGAMHSAGLQSPMSFDANVVQADKDARQAEMERLYAAVMQHQEEKEQARVLSQELRPEVQQDPISPRRGLPRIDTLRAVEGNGGLPTPTSPQSPRSPIRAIYPPDSPIDTRHRPTATSPIRAEYPTIPPIGSQPASPTVTRTQAQPSSPRSFLSRRSRSSSMSQDKDSKTKKALKNIRISAPMQRYPHDLDNEAKTPLTPRHYNDPGPAPEPPTASTVGTMDSATREAFSYEGLDKPQPLPRPAPQRLGSGSEPQQLQQPPSSRSAAQATSTSNGTRELPLRAFTAQSTSPTSDVPSTKTTYLERKKQSLALGTPKTGVPSTPYSPYMPYTPVTPVTPSHLVGKRERKMKKKEMGKRVPTKELDLVREDAEVWGDGY